MSNVVTFHLVRERGWRSWRAWHRLTTDARWLRRLGGVRFVRVLGTARGASTGPSVDLGRVGVFIVWDDDEAVDRHARVLADRWCGADEVWWCRLRPMSATGSWAGHRFDAPSDHRRDASGPVVVVTRGAIRWRSVPAFQRASHRTRAAAAAAPGCRSVVGIGEAPIVRLGTFSVWDDAECARRFARDHPAHRRSVGDARAGQWFGEELFAWFEPVGSSGTWDGVDPLADVRGA